MHRLWIQSNGETGNRPLPGQDTNQNENYKGKIWGIESELRTDILRSLDIVVMCLPGFEGSIRGLIKPFPINTCNQMQNFSTRI